MFLRAEKITDIFRAVFLSWGEKTHVGTHVPKRTLNAIGWFGEIELGAGREGWSVEVVDKKCVLCESARNTAL
eukprot:9376564-Ditylum_brightwellii.AAC.1